MKLGKMGYSMYLLAVLSCVTVSFAVHAQDEMKSDKTGTNPINFTFDARIYNEYQWLDTAGDGNQNITTFEFRAPILDGKWQFRLRARGVGIEADLNDDGVDDLNDSGWGDSDFRFLTVPYLC